VKIIFVIILSVRMRGMRAFCKEVLLKGYGHEDAQGDSSVVGVGLVRDGLGRSEQCHLDLGADPACGLDGHPRESDFQPDGLL
jgi:hypothetical protein